MVSTRLGRAAMLVGAGVIIGAIIGGSSVAGKDGDSLAAQIQRVEDRQAIEQLMLGDYPRALDSANWKVYASFFAHNGELITGGNTITGGPAAIEAYFNRPRAPRAGAPANPEPRVGKHVVTNLTIQISGDRATAQGYWQTVFSRPSGTTIAGAGHYEDVLIKERGTWKFLKRAIINDTPPAAPASTR
jgi:hypothetical protein